ncbi:MAG: hypothetical protein NTY08_13995 [Proteobacteria bacterium]|nr:hypothetical protein [Pseudomonadota bacterium]
MTGQTTGGLRAGPNGTAHHRPVFDVVAPCLVHQWLAAAIKASRMNKWRRSPARAAA